MSLNRIANAFTSIGNYPKSLEYHLQSLRTAEQAKDEVSMMNAMSNIANDHSYQGNYRLGIDYLFQAMELARKRNDRFRLARYMVNLGDSYEKLHILDSARYFTNQGYDQSVLLKDNDNIGIALNNLGNIYAKMGQDMVAMANYKMSLPYFISQNNEESLCEPYLGMAGLFKKAEDQDSSLYYARLSLQMARKGGFVPQIMNAAEFLTDYFTSINHIDRAFAYQSEMIVAKDSIFSQEKQREIQTLTFEEAMRQQEIAEAKAVADEERSDNIQFAIIAIAIITFRSIFFIVSHTVIVNEKWIRFLGVLGLLLFFEFLNLVIHPYLSGFTHHSPFYTLLAMVAMAAFLIPVHHKIEHWIKEKVVAKNKGLRLKAVQRMMAQLKKEEDIIHNEEEKEEEKNIPE